MARGIVLAAVLALLTAGAAKAGEADVNRLAWLSGGWATEDDGRWTEEHWTAPRGGVMLGVNLSGCGENARAFEFLRIGSDAEGNIVYLASPGGRTPVPFRLVFASESEAVFENPEHDFPTRIAYRRNGDRLTATISGPDGANAVSWTFRRR